MEMLTVECLLSPLQQFYAQEKTLLKFILFKYQLRTHFKKCSLEARLQSFLKYKEREKQKVEELNCSRYFADAVNPT